MDAEAYKRNPEKFYSFLKGIGEAEFNTLNDELGGDVDKSGIYAGRDLHSLPGRTVA